MAFASVTKNDSLLARTSVAVSTFKRRARSRRLAQGLLSFDDRLLADLGLERGVLTDFT